MYASLGNITRLKPFFMQNPTEKEQEMCLHRYCLNLRLEFNASMDHSKNNIYTSISDFYMSSCACEKSENGNWIVAKEYAQTVT